MDTVAENVRPLHAESNGAAVDTPPTAEEMEGIEIVNTVDDLDYERKAPKRLSPELLKEIRQSRDDETFTLKLHQMSIRQGEELTAQVRLVNLTEKTLLIQLPSNVRDLVQRLFFSNAPSGAKKPNKAQQMDQTATRLRDVAYAYGCAGFVDPKLVLNEADEDIEGNVWWVKRIPLHDLTEYVRINEGDDQLASRRLERFSE